MNVRFAIQKILKKYTNIIDSKLLAQQEQDLQKYESTLRVKYFGHLLSGFTLNRFDQAVPVGNMGKFYLAPGTGPCLPIEDYIGRFAEYAEADFDDLVRVLIYLLRIERNTQALLSERNIHRLFATAYLLNMKFWQDKYDNNAYIAKVTGVVCNELNVLEVEFLFQINFSLWIEPKEFILYRQVILEIFNSYGCIYANIAMLVNKLRVNVSPIEFINQEIPLQPRSLSKAICKTLKMNKYGAEDKNDLNEPIDIIFENFIQALDADDRLLTLAFIHFDDYAIYCNRFHRSRVYQLFFASFLFCQFFESNYPQDLNYFSQMTKIPIVALEDLLLEFIDGIKSKLIRPLAWITIYQKIIAPRGLAPALDKKNQDRVQDLSFLAASSPLLEVEKYQLQDYLNKSVPTHYQQSQRSRFFANSIPLIEVEQLADNSFTSECKPALCS